MKHKLFYTQPTTDLLELRSEGIICLSNFGTDNAPGLIFSTDGDTIITINDDF